MIFLNYFLCFFDNSIFCRFFSIELNTFFYILGKSFMNFKKYYYYYSETLQRFFLCHKGCRYRIIHLSCFFFISDIFQVKRHLKLQKLFSKTSKHNIFKLKLSNGLINGDTLITNPTGPYLILPKIVYQRQRQPFFSTPSKFKKMSYVYGGNLLCIFRTCLFYMIGPRTL